MVHLFSQPKRLNAGYMHEQNALSFPPSGSGTQRVIFSPLCCYQPFRLLALLPFKLTTTWDFFLQHVAFEWGRRHGKIKRHWALEGDLNSVSGSATYLLCDSWVHALSSETLTSKIKAVPAYCLGVPMRRHPLPPALDPTGAHVSHACRQLPTAGVCLWLCLKAPSGHKGLSCALVSLVFSKYEVKFY